MTHDKQGRVADSRSRRRARTLLRAGAGALIAAGVLSACGGGSDSAGSEGGTTTMHIASAPGDVYIPDEISLEQGFFGKHDIEVDKFVYPQSGVQAVQLMTSGAIDAQQQDTLLTFAAYANGQKGKRPMIIGMRMPTITYAIVTNKGFGGADATASFEEKMSSLKGKTIGVPAIGAGADQQLTLALQEAGMKDDSVTRIAVGQFGPMTSQMKAGRVDAVVTQTWATSRIMAASTGGQLYVDFADPSVPEIISGQEVGPLIAREEFLEKNPEAIQNYLDVQTDTKDWMLANQQEAADFLNTKAFDGKAADLSTAYMAHWAADVAPKIDEQWRMSRASFDRMHEVAVRLGILKEGQIKYEDIVADFARED